MLLIALKGTAMHQAIASGRASEKPFFAKFVRLMVRPSMGLFVRKYRKKTQIVPDAISLISITNDEIINNR